MKNKVTNGFEIVQDLIKLRWVPEILKSIKLGNTRYTDILKSINGMSHTELNRKLLILADKNVIHKDENDVNAVYQLQKFGNDLVHIFNHLEELEDKYFNELTQVN